MNVTKLGVSPYSRIRMIVKNILLMGLVRQRDNRFYGFWIYLAKGLDRRSHFKFSDYNL